MPRNPHCLLFQGVPGWTMKSFFLIAARVREFVPDAEVRVYLSGETPKPTIDDPQVVYSHRQDVAWCEAQMASTPCSVYTRFAMDYDFDHAAVWCYPTHLPQAEDAATIREAQLHGCIPVINPIGALAENMTGGVPMWGIPRIDALVRARYACEITRLLADQALQEEIRGTMVEAAQARWKVMASYAAD